MYRSLRRLAGLVYFGPKPLTEAQRQLPPYYRCLRRGKRGSMAGGWRRSEQSETRPCANVFRRAPTRACFLRTLSIGPRIDTHRRMGMQACFQQPSCFVGIRSLFPIIAMGIIDLLSFGSIFHSVWKNWQLNVTQHLSEDFGVEPGYGPIADFISE